jgi:hypothetical protein
LPNVQGATGTQGSYSWVTVGLHQLNLEAKTGTTMKHHLGGQVVVPHQKPNQGITDVVTGRIVIGIVLTESS